MVLDGALATELERRGADLDDPLWSAKCLIERPELIRQVHLDYFRAGADVATTATYQASFEGYARRGIDRRAAAQLMRSAVTLALAARDEFWSTGNRAGRLRPLVATSIGPYGAMLADGSEYRGQYGVSDVDLADFHRRRLEVLADAGADLLACETIPCLSEALVLASVLEEFPALCGWLSFSCRDGALNCAGEPIAACAAALRDHPQIVALGANCTAPQYIPALLGQLRGITDKPLVVYPNSGEVYDAKTKRWSSAASAEIEAEAGQPARAATPFGEQARAWYAAGARLIGGCCRTRPADILGVRQCVLA